MRIGHSWLKERGVYGLNGWSIYDLSGWGIHDLKGWGIYDLNGWGIYDLNEWGICGSNVSNYFLGNMLKRKLLVVRGIVHTMDLDISDDGTNFIGHFVVSTDIHGICQYPGMKPENWDAATARP